MISKSHMSNEGFIQLQKTAIQKKIYFALIVKVKAGKKDFF